MTINYRRAAISFLVVTLAGVGWGTLAAITMVSSLVAAICGLVLGGAIMLALSGWYTK